MTKEKEEQIKMEEEEKEEVEDVEEEEEIAISEVGSDPLEGEVVLKQEFETLSKVQKGYTKVQKKFIRDTLAPGLSDNELALFLYESQKLGLNPLRKEIYAWAYDKKGRREFEVFVSRDGLRKIAFENGHLEKLTSEAIYVKEKVYTEKTPDEDFIERKEVLRCSPWGGKLWGAKATAVRDDYSEPFEVIVPLSEYKTDKYIWDNKPDTMIKKVAESQVLRMAFPVLGGVYAEEEEWDRTREAGAPEMKAPKIKGGDKPAKESQIAALRSMDVEFDDDITRQEAADLLVSNSRKGVNKE